MPTARSGWKRKFSVPIRLADGTVLRTLADARAYLIDLGDHQPPMQVAAGALLEAASGGSIDTAESAVQIALFTRLDHAARSRARSPRG